MNVLFHSITAIGVSVFITDNQKPASGMWDKSTVAESILALILGIIFHGILDYIPHCYPIPSKVDAIVSLIGIIAVIWLTNMKYKLVVIASFLGSVLPDLIDLSPNIISKLFRFNIPVLPKIFPWHWPAFSGSIYNGNCGVSNFNHFMIITLVFIICLVRYRDFKALFLK